MTHTYSSDYHEMSASKSLPEKSTCESGEDSASQHDRTLWDITTPEEVAHSIQEFYPDPMEEFFRRQAVALKAKHAENIRFWDSVRQVLS